MNQIYLKKILLLFRLFLVVCALVLFLYLFIKDFVPGGVLELRNDFKFKDNQISDLYPEVRLGDREREGSGDWFQNIYIDPVYFKVTPSREFRQAKLRIKYRIKRQPLFQIGVKAGAGDMNFRFETLNFRKLDELDWYKIRQGDLVLYQKNKNFNTIDEFLSDLPQVGRVATYNFKLEAPAGEDYETTVLNLETDLDQVSYIIANYSEPVSGGSWLASEAEFAVSRDIYEDGGLIFMLSAPGLDVNKGDIDVSEIVVELRRPKFEGKKAFGEFREYLRRVFDK